MGEREKDGLSRTAPLAPTWLIALVVPPFAIISGHAGGHAIRAQTDTNIGARQNKNCQIAARALGRAVYITQQEATGTKLRQVRTQELTTFRNFHAYENTWKCGELKLYFSPSAGG